MLAQEWLLVSLIIGSGTALAPGPRQNIEESLKSALDAIARKQRSLDTNSQEYRNDLRLFKYRGDDGERKFDRERQGEREMEEEEDEIEFLPNDVGQLETVGNGFQDLNNKLLERALMDYLENVQQQEEPVTSLFRERERSSSRKRGSNSEKVNVANKELANLVLGELQDGSPYNVEDTDDEDYSNARQMMYDRSRDDRNNKLYENSGRMSWGELLNKESMVRGQGAEMAENEFSEREQDPNLLYLAMGERRNGNGGLPMEWYMKTYRNMAKRYPVSKRSPKPLPNKQQITDPKVAQDLGALFGTQSTDGQNHTHNHGHEDSHDHEHNHEHEHDHGEQRKHESSSEAPKATSPPKGQKENAAKLNKAQSIEVRKKSVDWSQYFGIDRRKKKAAFMAGPETQNQDDDWLLQRYYENMVENLKGNERDYETEGGERKEKADRPDLKQKNIKDLILEEALRNAASGDGIDLQKVKDKVMARMAAAYSLEKMRKALNELRNNVMARVEAQKAARSQNNQTSSFRENNGAPKSKDKRTQNNLIEAAGENLACPELEAIEKQCRAADSLAGDESQLLYLPCVMLQICKACVQDELQDECLGNYAVKAGKVCEEIRDGQKGKEACASAALILSQLQPPAAVSMQCRIDGNDSCLRRYHYRYGHRYLRYPYGGRRLSNGYDMIGPQQSNR